MDEEDFKSVSLVEFLAKSKLSSSVSVLLQAYGELEDGTFVFIELPDDLMVAAAKLVFERISLPGVEPRLTVVRHDSDED